jgi:hypothetical protein
MFWVIRPSSQESAEFCGSVAFRLGHLMWDSMRGGHLMWPINVAINSEKKKSEVYHIPKGQLDTHIHNWHAESYNGFYPCSWTSSWNKFSKGSTTLCQPLATYYYIIPMCSPLARWSPISYLLCWFLVRADCLPNKTIKMEGIEGGNVGIACIYAPNIPKDRRHLWHIMVDSLPKDCDWILKGGDFNMTKRPHERSNDCSRAISDLVRYTWNNLLSTLHINNIFIHHGGPRFSWNNGHKGQAQRLVKLDRFYTHVRRWFFPSHFYFFWLLVIWMILTSWENPTISFVGSFHSHMHW